MLRDWCNILGSKELREHSREKSLSGQTFVLSSRESQSLGWATQAPAPGYMNWGHSGTPDAIVKTRGRSVAVRARRTSLGFQTAGLWHATGSPMIRNLVDLTGIEPVTS